MNKNTFAPLPPMGWNSYDYYDTTVCEEDVRRNAEYMAEHMKKFGWEYIVIDIEWFAPNAGTRRDRYQYIPFDTLSMDEYGRLTPAENRFPSAAGGKGFKPLSDYIHSLGLKFGIHIMRGIPREAVHKHLPVYNTDTIASEIADPSSICRWNPDMYGVDASREGAQEYYDSIFELYAAWGVDYVKVDDICNTNMWPHAPYSGKKEIEMIASAIQKCGRPIVLSLSPGPALIDQAWHLKTYANMWRITDDFWDEWYLLEDMFKRCELWESHVGEGCWPDCDMLPMGVLGHGFGNEWMSRFTEDESRTMLSLWCIFRSPLMLGTEMPRMDDALLKMLTNEGILRMQQHGHGAHQLFRDEKGAAWISYDEDGRKYLALFNFCEEAGDVTAPLPEDFRTPLTRAEELWTGEDVTTSYNRQAGSGSFTDKVSRHGSRVYRLTAE